MGGGVGGVHVVAFNVSRCVSTLFRCTCTHLTQFSSRSFSTIVTGASDFGRGCSNCVCVTHQVCFSLGVFSRSLSLNSVGICQIRALPLVFTYCHLVNFLACVSSLSGSIVVSAARNVGPLMNFFSQSISGLICCSHGYPKIM